MSMTYLAFNVILKVVCLCSPCIRVLAGGHIDEDRFFMSVPRGNVSHYNIKSQSSLASLLVITVPGNPFCHPLLVAGDQLLKTSEISSLNSRPCSW